MDDSGDTLTKEGRPAGHCGPGTNLAEAMPPGSFSRHDVQGGEGRNEERNRGQGVRKEFERDPMEGVGEGFPQGHSSGSQSPDLTCPI